MIRLTAAALAMAATQAVQGQDVPELRKGIWDLKKVINGRPYDVRRCMDPFADLIRQHTELSASGCSFKVIKKTQMQWEIHSTNIRRSSPTFRFQTCLRRLSSIGARSAEAVKALGPDG